MDFATDDGGQTDDQQTPSVSPVDDKMRKMRDKKLVKQIEQTVRADKSHFSKAFDRMREDMHLAFSGADKSWHKGHYRANFAGRHVKQKTAALYAKNPQSVARRRETLDFAEWDENPQGLMLAMQIVEQAAQQMQAMAVGAPDVDENGVPVQQSLEIDPQQQEATEQARAIVADYQQGQQRRVLLAKYGKTLEILFSHSLKEQKPVDFKRGMKSVVRRAVTTGVGYVKLAFQRETGMRPVTEAKLVDLRERLDHMRNLAERIGDPESGIEADSAEIAELEYSIAQIEAEPEVVMREGLIIDYPQATKVIPDKRCTALDGFVNANHLTIEHTYSIEEVEELFGVDLKGKYKNYTASEGSTNYVSEDDVTNQDYEWGGDKRNGLVCVWEYYDKPAGLVYYIADGYDEFLRPPAAPDVFVEDFWPVYALTFNAVESETELMPPSDVRLMRDMQEEHNRSRQGLREHRQAARPRYVYASGVFEEKDLRILRALRPFEAAGLNIDSEARIADVLQSVPVPGVDPNLYETGPIFADTQIVVGAQEAQFGGVSKATATETSIAANASQSSDSASVDDLDSFLTTIARASGQILQREMSEEQVQKIVGPGYVWPDLTLADIYSEMSLEVEAGSTGKPNQAVEIDNWKQMLPMVLQVPGISPEWLARETLRRLDDKMDLTEALSAGLPSIAAQNSQSQQTQQPPQDPANAPDAQGAQGAQNAPKPPEERGTGPAFGSNQT